MNDNGKRERAVGLRSAALRCCISYFLNVLFKKIFNLTEMNGNVCMERYG